MIESTCNMAGGCVAASIPLRHSADLGAKDAGGKTFTTRLRGAAAWLLNGGVLT